MARFGSFNTQFRASLKVFHVGHHRFTTGSHEKEVTVTWLEVRSNYHVTLYDSNFETPRLLPIMALCYELMKWNLSWLYEVLHWIMQRDIFTQPLAVSNLRFLYGRSVQNHATFLLTIAPWPVMFKGHWSNDLSVASRSIFWCYLCNTASSCNFCEMIYVATQNYDLPKEWHIWPC